MKKLEALQESQSVQTGARRWFHSIQIHVGWRPKHSYACFKNETPRRSGTLTRILKKINLSVYDVWMYFNLRPLKKLSQMRKRRNSD